MGTHREVAIKIISPGLYATYHYWPVKCFSYVKSEIMLFNVTCCRLLEKTRLPCASGLWTLLCLEKFWYSNRALHFLCNFQHAQPCTLFQRLWYYPEAITKGKKNRNYLSSSYLFKVLEKWSDKGLPIIRYPLSVNFSINWARGLLTNKIYYSSENTLFKAPDLQSISLVIAIKLSWKLIYAIVFPL